jgi:hypothetical protein
MFLPHILWQIRYDWPTVEFIREASRGKMLVNTPLSFLLDQVKNMQPIALPVWGAGLVALFAAPGLRRYRLLGILFVTVTIILVLNRTSRSGYLAAAYPMLFAAGGAWWETRLEQRWLRVAFVVVILVGGLATMPLAVPLLPVGTYLRYSAALGVAPGTDEKSELGRLPQFFADRQHWDAFVDQVGAAWDRLTPEEQRRAAVLTNNYGEAGAIELFGRARDMAALSGHNNYWLWGPGDRPGDPLIVLSRSRAHVEALFRDVEQVGETDCGDCMPYENHLPIFIGRGIRKPLAEQWPAFKHFN